MATEAEIEKAFMLIVGAGLDFTPNRDEIPLRIESWCEFLKDIPGSTLVQAAKDIVIAGEKFPSVPTIRKQAEKVKAHNNTSAVSNPFVDLVTNIEKDRFFTATVDGWQKWQPSGRQGKPYPREVFTRQAAPPIDQNRHIYPPEVLAELREIAKRTGDGILSEADHERIEQLTEGYLNECLPSYRQSPEPVTI